MTSQGTDVSTARPDLGEAIARGDRDRIALRERLASRKSDLPLRYWRQQAHFTTPAAEASMARKAVEGGTAPVARILDRFGSDRGRPRRPPGLPTSARRAAARTPRPGAPRDARCRGRARARTRRPPSRCRSPRRAAGRRLERAAARRRLRFYRPPGLDLGTTVRELYALLWRIRRAGSVGRLPARRDRLSQGRASRGGRPPPRYARRGRGGAGPAGRRSGSAYLVESGWARHSSAPSPASPRRAFRASSSGWPTTAPTSGCPPSATTTPSRTGRVPRSWRSPARSACRPSTA